ncbi:MAG: barstar family protein [Cyclobacteriaceae bacterium]
MILDELVISIDTKDIRTIENVHVVFKKSFGFPKFYGENFHALVDCLSSLRYPEDEMTEVSISFKQIIVLKFSDFITLSEKIRYFILSAIHEVNKREKMKGNKEMIYLLI